MKTRGDYSGVLTNTQKRELIAEIQNWLREEKVDSTLQIVGKSFTIRCARKGKKRPHAGDTLTIMETKIDLVTGDILEPSLDARALEILKEQPMTAGELGAELWGYERFVNRRESVWPENASNRFCRPAGRLLHKLKKDRKVYGPAYSVSRQRFLWRLAS